MNFTKKYFNPKVIIQLILTINLVIGITFGSFTQTNQILAANTPDFEFDEYYTLIVDQPRDTTVTVKHAIRIEGNNSKYTLPLENPYIITLPDYDAKSGPSEQQFKISTLKVTDRSDKALSFNTDTTGSGIELQISIPANTEVTSNNYFELNVEYDTHELINVSGNITNIYIPGLVKDTQFSITDPTYNLLTTLNYHTTLQTPLDFPKLSYLQPKTVKITESSDYVEYKVDQEDRLGQITWLQFGETQYYHFKLIQEVPQTDTLTPEELSRFSELISRNILEITLPREYAETNQQVFISEILPEPEKIETDEEGNLIATFDIAANQENTITVEGYLQLSSQPNYDPLDPIFTDLSLTDYYTEIEDLHNLPTYLTSEPFWQVDDPEIKQISQNLSENARTISELLLIDYNYVVDSLEYSYDKVATSNERVGALEALRGAPAVCMEYADLLVTILRAQGIPARAAYGYGNDPTDAENTLEEGELLKQEIGHQWVQAWIPGYGWLSLDPTWGEAQRTYIGGDLDHVLWYTMADTRASISDATIYSADPINGEVFDGYTLYLEPISETEIVDLDLLTDTVELANEYNSQTSSLEFNIKTTPLGRAGIVILPACTSLLFVYIIALAVFKAIRRKNTRRPEPTSPTGLSNTVPTS